MSNWPSTKANRVYRALLKIGWKPKPTRKKGSSHVQLIHPDLPEYTWAWHDSDEIGPVMLKKIAKLTGLRPEDL
jgi:predicted RNA binding protein YcfA (HicA-like mRNA interferase family)